METHRPQLDSSRSTVSFRYREGVEMVPGTVYIVDCEFARSDIATALPGTGRWPDAITINLPRPWLSAIPLYLWP